MGEKNNVMCEYLGRPEVFADFLNGSLFLGERVIDKSEIFDGEKQYNVKLKDKKGNKRRVERERDVLKRILRDRKYIIIGIENQDEVHEFMPLRCLEYDMLEYNRQMRELIQRNRNKEKLSGNEFLSGVKKGDHLCPVVTIVFYHGKNDYGGCKSLYDMLDFKGEGDIFKRYVADYQMNLVTLKDLDEEVFETGLRELVAVIKRSEDKEALWKYCQENKERISQLDEVTFDTISTMINQKDIIKFKSEIKEERGYNMCKAIEDMMADSRNEGIFKILSELVNDGLLKLEEAAKRMEISEADFMKKMQEMKE